MKRKQKNNRIVPSLLLLIFDLSQRLSEFRKIADFAIHIIPEL